LLARITSLFFLHHHRAPPDPPSFPTRRSSDLLQQLPQSGPILPSRRWWTRRMRPSLFLQHAQLPRWAASCASNCSSVMPCCLVRDRKSTRLNSSHVATSYAVFCLQKKVLMHQT